MDARCSTPILTMPIFTKIFFLECVSLGRGLKLVLMKEGNPFLAFTIKQLCDCNLGKSTNEKEMMDILLVVET